MNVISYANANKHKAIIISHDINSSDLYIAIAYDVEHKTINVELYEYEDTLVDFVAAKTVPAAKKALQEIAAKAYEICPAMIYSKLIKSQAYGDMVPYQTMRNNYYYA